MTTKTGRNAVIYVRAKDNPSGDEFIERQLISCIYQANIDALGIEKIFVERNGGMNYSKSFNQLLSMCRYESSTKPNYIILYSFDRLTRYEHDLRMAMDIFSNNGITVIIAPDYL